MKMPAIIRKENRAPVAWAAILTFIAWNAFGFGWFGLPNLGFVTAGGAEQLANGEDGKGRDSACRATLRNEVQRSGFGDYSRKKGKASGSAIYPGQR